jgi:hypothetical protein
MGGEGELMSENERKEKKEKQKGNRGGNNVFFWV